MQDERNEIIMVHAISSQWEHRGPGTQTHTNAEDKVVSLSLIGTAPVVCFHSRSALV